MFKRLSAIAIVAALALPAQADDASTVVATVNGVEITVGHMIVARATLPQQYQQLPDEVLFTGILDQLIQQTALQQAHKGELPPRVVLAMENETRSLTAAETIERIMADAVTPMAIREAYEANYDTDAPTREFNASHILVETEEAALEIVAELEGGAVFEGVAREKSTGPSGPSGGSLGWFGPGMMVAPFELAVADMQVGEISAPVKTQFGWHVIKLNETRVKDVPALEEVREEIEQLVREEAVSKRIEALVASSDVDKKAAADIDPTILRQLELVD